MAQELAESKTIVRLTGRKASILKVLEDFPFKIEGEVILADLYTETIAEFKVQYKVHGNWYSDIYRRVNKRIADCNVTVKLEIQYEDFKRKVVESEDGAA